MSDRAIFEAFMMLARRLGILGTRQTLRVVDSGAEGGWAYQCLTAAPDTTPDGRARLLCLHHVGHEGAHSWETANVGIMAPADWSTVQIEYGGTVVERPAPDPAEFAVNVCGVQGPRRLTCGRAPHAGIDHRARNSANADDITAWLGRWSDPDDVVSPGYVDLGITDRVLIVEDDPIRLGGPIHVVRCSAASGEGWRCIFPELHGGAHEWSDVDNVRDLLAQHRPAFAQCRADGCTRLAAPGERCSQCSNPDYMACPPGEVVSEVVVTGYDPSYVGRIERAKRCEWVNGPGERGTRCTLNDGHSGPHECSNPSQTPS